MRVIEDRACWMILLRNTSAMVFSRPRPLAIPLHPLEAAGAESATHFSLLRGDTSLAPSCGRRTMATIASSLLLENWPDRDAWLGLFFFHKKRPTTFLCLGESATYATSVSGAVPRLPDFAVAVQLYSSTAVGRRQNASKHFHNGPTALWLLQLSFRCTCRGKKFQMYTKALARRRTRFQWHMLLRFLQRAVTKLMALSLP